GRIEVSLKEQIKDKTNWRKMLKNEWDDNIDLIEKKYQLLEHLSSELLEYVIHDDEIMKIEYPVQQYPYKIKSLSFDKNDNIEGTLQGIKGQYLLFDNNQVINVRKFGGYEVEMAD
ncbi:MAG: DUF2797 domain-containing protein, partial [Flavobacteriales bacterium]